MSSRHQPLNGADSPEGLTASMATADRPTTLEVEAIPKWDGLLSLLRIIDGLDAEAQIRMVRRYVGRVGR